MDSTQFKETSDTYSMMDRTQFKETSDTYSMMTGLSPRRPTIHTVWWWTGLSPWRKVIHIMQWYCTLYHDMVSHCMKLSDTYNGQGDLVSEAEWYILRTGWLRPWSPDILYTWSCHGALMTLWSPVILYLWSRQGDSKYEAKLYMWFRPGHCMKPSDTCDWTGWLDCMKARDKPRVCDWTRWLPPWPMLYKRKLGALRLRVAFYI